MHSNPRLPFRLSTEAPAYRPLRGARLIVHVVVNIEYWPYDAATPRRVVEPPHGRSHVPDLPNFCWSEYGNRCGMPRLLHLFGEREIPVSASMNASVLDVYPQLAEAVLDAGWELVGHGIHQRSMATDADEEAVVEEALAKLEAFGGTRPRGWMSPGWSETFDTLDVLSRAGIQYVHQWVIDDLPTWLATRREPMISLPYALDLNDSVIYAIEKHSSPEMTLRIRRTVETFEREIAATGQPRVLTIPLHPHLSGVPHRVGYLRELIDELLARDDTTFVAAKELATWFEGHGPPLAAPAEARNGK